MRAVCCGMSRGLHPRHRRREHGREPGLARRALREDLRYQHAPLHLLRLLRGRVPRASDRAGTRVRGVGHQPREVHLHHGEAAGAAAARRRSAAERQEERGDVGVAIAVFLVAAAMAVAGGIGVITFRKPIRCVLSLVVVMIALSILFLLLSAQFVFVVQIIVYAGAVMVLFLFVVALLGPARESARGRLRFQPWLAALFSVVFPALVWVMLQGVQSRHPAITDSIVFGTVHCVALLLRTKYVYPFELASLLLLVAPNRAIYQSKR